MMGQIRFSDWVFGMVLFCGLIFAVYFAFIVAAVLALVATGGGPVALY